MKKKREKCKQIRTNLFKYDDIRKRMTPRQQDAKVYMKKERNK